MHRTRSQTPAAARLGRLAPFGFRRRFPRCGLALRCARLDIRSGALPQCLNQIGRPGRLRRRWARDLAALNFRLHQFEHGRIAAVVEFLGVEPSCFLLDNVQREVEDFVIRIPVRQFTEHLLGGANLVIEV